MCEKCAPYGGKWKITEKGAERCDCEIGKQLADIDAARGEGRSQPPVLSDQEALIAVEMLSGKLTYVPSLGESIARVAIAKEFQAMCRDFEEAEWLVNRMGKLFKSWPGTRELRLVYCSKHRPLDGIELAGRSEAYPDGIPSEKETAGALPSPDMKFLSPGKGEPVSAADSLNEAVLAMAEAKHMKHARGPRPPVPDIPILPPGQRITEADIEAAVSANRAAAAKKEFDDDDE